MWTKPISISTQESTKRFGEKRDSKARWKVTRKQSAHQASDLWIYAVDSPKR
jgi:hypothetical protein